MSTTKFFPLGGLGEIGSNTSIFETPEQNLIIDAGILFPKNNHFDINYLIPHYPMINQLTGPKRLIITHGHEDHIGAIDHFLKEVQNIEDIYCPRFCYEILREKRPHLIRNFEFQVFEDFQEIKFREESIQFVPVNHSIAQTYAIVLKQPRQKRCFVFASDFKVDLDPVFENPFPDDYFLQLKKEFSSRVLFADSTNILNPGKTTSERELRKDIEEIISETQKSRLFVTMFSSNSFRMATIAELAKKYNRKVYCLGRSAHSYRRAALKMDEFKEALSWIEDIENDFPNKRNGVYIVTGCQGEFFGALRRLVDDQFKGFLLKEGDTFAFSSKSIPGNETQVNKLLNQLAQKKIKIITAYDKLIHASGHASQQDLKHFIELIQPTQYVPIHGETYFLNRQLEFIQNEFPAMPTHRILNYQKLLFSDDGVQIDDSVEGQEPRLIHGPNNLEIERGEISHRRKLATLGLITLSVNSNNLKSFSLNTMGIPQNPDLHPTSKQVSSLVGRIFRSKIGHPTDTIKEQLRVELRKLYSNKLGYKPVTIVQIV